MLHPYSLFVQRLLAIWLGVLPLSAWAQGRKPMPTAALPMEPATADTDVSEEPSREAPPVEARPAPVTRSRPTRISGGRDTSFQGGLLMAREGFGAQLRILEYSSSWLAMSQALRFQSPQQDDALYEKQYGLMLGLELHPWHEARFSPLFALQAGGDRYERGLEREVLDLFGVEASAGVELRLARAAAFAFHWTEVYYPGLNEPLLADQKPGVRYAGRFEVYFKVLWDGVM